MPRIPRAAETGLVYHALNRAVARLAIFHRPDDYAAFLRVLAQAVATREKGDGANCRNYLLRPLSRIPLGGGKAFLEIDWESGSAGLIVRLGLALCIAGPCRGVRGAIRPRSERPIRSVRL